MISGFWVMTGHHCECRIHWTTLIIWSQSFLFFHSETETNTSEHFVPLQWVPDIEHVCLLKCPFFCFYLSRICLRTPPGFIFCLNPVSHHLSGPLIRPGVWEKWTVSLIWQNTPLKVFKRIKVRSKDVFVCMYVYTVCKHAEGGTAYLWIATNVTRDCFAERAVCEDNVLLAGHFGHDFDHIQTCVVGKTWKKPPHDTSSRPIMCHK